MICPNVNLPEWKTLEAEVGKFEAYKDFLETDGDIRTPDKVKAKIEAREMKSEQERSWQKDLSELEESVNSQEEPSLGSTVEQLKNSRAVELANKMSDSLGIDYNLISAADAAKITENTQNPWAGEAAFFVGGKVYFIADKINTDLVLHEFSHPLVRAISKENAPLFNKLYSDLAATAAGQEIIAEVKKIYPFLENKDSLFMEEVIVRGIERAGKQEAAGEKVEQSLGGWIKEMLFNLKQMLRRVFGRAIPVSKLSTTTSLNDLAAILSKGDKIQINTELVSEEEIVAYNKDLHSQVTEDLGNVTNDELKSHVNTLYDMITKHLNTLLRNENYEELAKLLTDEYMRGDLQEIRSNLSQYQTVVKESAEKLRDDVYESKRRVEAFTSSLIRLDSVMNKVLEHTRDLATQPDTQDNMHKAYYYNKLIKHWGQFIDQVVDSLDDVNNRVPADATVHKLVNGVKSNIRKTKQLIDGMYADGARDAIYEQLEPLNRNISNRYEEVLKNLRKNKAPQSRIDQIYKQYHGMSEKDYTRFTALAAKEKKGSLTLGENKELQALSQLSKKGVSVTPEKIEQLLKGQMGDANFFNSYLEGYLYNTDPIIGGLALYTKNKLNDMMIVTQQKYNAFATDIESYLKNAGYNPTQIGQLGKDVGFEDTVMRWSEEEGKMVERKVMTFLNPFKNYRSDVQRHREEVEAAHEAYNFSHSKEDREVLVEAVAKQKEFLRKYFHQEYVSQFYERQALFEKDAIGREAAFVREEIMDRIRKVNEVNNTQLDQIEAAKELDLLWREYKQMHSRYDLKGNLKVGEDAAIAARLREYRDASREFYEFKPRKGVFENAYFSFQQELRSAGIEESTDPDSTWVQKMEAWKAKNTRVQIKPEFYEKRDRILANIKGILGDRNKDLDQGVVWEKILEITGGFRDDDGQPNAIEMDEEAIARVAELQEELERIKEESLLRSGLTRKESQDLSDLHDKKKAQGGKLSFEDSKTMRALYDKKDEFGLSKFDAAALNGYYAQLAALSSKQATDYYVDVLNNWLDKLDPKSLNKDFKISSVDNLSAELLLSPNYVDELKAQDAEFAEWWNANHIEKEFFNKDTGETETKYERLYVWSVVKPNDPTMMETTEIKDPMGKVIDTISGVPGMDYHARVVKEKYRTRNIVGITKDNQGQFLPKTVEEGAADGKYRNEKYYEMRDSADPKVQAKFKLLERLKDHHLRNQEGLSYRSKLYLDFPRFRKGNLETLQTVSLLGKARDKIQALTYFAKRAKEFIRGGEDDFENGLNHDDNQNIIRADIFDNEMTDIPIAGLYDIDAEDVSTNITLSMMRYMASAERQKQLVKMSPVVRAIQETVNNVANPDRAVKEAKNKEMRNRGLMKYSKKFDNVRGKAINNFIEREFEGKTQADRFGNTPWINNISNFLFKRASFSFFALNIPSALKNSLGMKFQFMIEASGGKHVSHKSLQQGNVWAYKAMAELSFKNNLKTRGTKSHMLQLIDVFDPIQGRFEEKFATEMSRTTAEDLASMSWLYSPRKWVEIQAGIQLFGGMMYKKKVTQKLADGTTKEIPYIDAFETVDGQIRLKAGIDARYNLEQTVHKVESGDTVESIAAKYNIPVEDAEKALRGKEVSKILRTVNTIEARREAELNDVDPALATSPAENVKLMDKRNAINKKYDKQLEDKGTVKIDNTEFKYLKNQIHQVQNNMGGAYAKFDQPEAQRYLAFRMVTFLKRFFTTMATNRWGFSGPIWDPKPRLNPGLGDHHMGFYIQFGQTMVNAIKNLSRGDKAWAFMTNEEKSSVLKMLTEVGMLYMLYMAQGLLFGWDDKDPERNAKLRAMSGSAPFLGLISDDPKRPDFDLLGYAELHTLHMIMQVEAENKQFNPMASGIKLYTDMITETGSVAHGPTTDAYFKIWDDFKNTVTGNPKAYYSRKVGPYTWQDKEGSKFITHFAKTFGLNGSTLDPAMAIQNFQSYQVKKL